jgi:hypothetical protein
VEFFSPQNIHGGEIMKVSRYVLLVLSFIFLASILPILGNAADQDRQALENLLADLEKKIKEADQRMVPYPKFLEELKVLIHQYRSRLQEPYHQGPGPRPSHLSRLDGLWFFNANNFPGRLEFYWTRNVWAGRMVFDNIGRWIELTDIFLDSRTGQLQFTAENQIYSGTLSGNRIVGTFAGGFPWEAWRQ